MNKAETGQCLAGIATLAWHHYSRKRGTEFRHAETAAGYIARNTGI
jgi:hypothetical protein